MYYASKQACKLPKDPKLAFCYDILNSVSRRCGAPPRCRCRRGAPPLRARPREQPRPQPGRGARARDAGAAVAPMGGRRGRRGRSKGPRSGAGAGRPRAPPAARAPQLTRARRALLAARPPASRS
jgi:hypothetical protein